jgi:hypothetical protein
VATVVYEGESSSLTRKRVTLFRGIPTEVSTADAKAFLARSDVKRYKAPNPAPKPDPDPDPDPDGNPAEGDIITLGFDGSLSDDHPDPDPNTDPGDGA